jgi:hypothetical protein
MGGPRIACAIARRVRGCRAERRGPAPSAQARARVRVQEVRRLRKRRVRERRGAAGPAIIGLVAVPPPPPLLLPLPISLLYKVRGRGTRGRWFRGGGKGVRCEREGGTCGSINETTAGWTLAHPHPTLLPAACSLNDGRGAECSPAATRARRLAPKRRRCVSACERLERLAPASEVSSKQAAPASAVAKQSGFARACCSSA